MVTLYLEYDQQPPNVTSDSDGENVRRTSRRVNGLLAFGTLTTMLAACGGAPSAEPGPARDRLAPAARGQLSWTPTAMPKPTAAAPHGPASGPSSRPRKRILANGRRQPLTVAVPDAASGHYVVVSGEALPPGDRRGQIIRYLVEVERGLPFERQEFAAEVHRILNDPRGWGHSGKLRFQRVDYGTVRVRVALSSPTLTDTQCLPKRTGGELSCWNGRRSVINAKRWGLGAASYGRDLASYREYVVNHEVGHGLGHGHVACPGPGKPAPVMVQQTKSLGGCRLNPWPFP